ncbi:MAG: PQQ-binding-like beta-propeller repeat protein [Planctomycetaceae bacterium]
MSRSRILPGLLLLSAALPLEAADRWPEWRGTTGQGVSDATNLPTRWSEEENVAWKTAVPGLGWSTPVIADGVVYLTTATHVPASKEEARERQKTTTNSQPLIISDSVSLSVVALDLKSGRILLTREVLTEQNPQMIHIDNSYATPTPVIDNNRLYCHFGPYGTVGLETKTLEVLWTNRDLRVKHENGPGSSPVLWNDILIIHCDGIDQQYIVALDKHTGNVAWKTARSGKLNDEPQLRKSYATPLIVDINSSPVVVSPAADWVYGYDPSTGTELWKLNYGVLGFSNAGRPVAGHGIAYICTGYMKAELLALKFDTSGRPQEIWRYTKQVPNVASPLLVGDELYFASDRGMVSCIDAVTGESLWTERIGSRYWASPICADGRLYFFDKDGTTTVLKPGRRFEQLSQNRLDGELMATAAAVDGSLLLRTDKAVYCLRENETP